MGISGPRGVVTHARDAQLAAAYVGDASNLEIVSFRIGEGGWEMVAQDLGPAIPGPKTPVASRVGLEAVYDLDTEVTNPDNEPVWIAKALTSGDFDYDDGVLQVTCGLGESERNDNGNGRSPRFWEIGLFNANGDMLYYATFPGAYKVAGIPWTITLNLRLR